MPKISIIVPVYNVEKYLEECLDSLISQTFEDIEIICVNDGSTDSSGSILEKYESKDKRIKVINKENTGYGHSMNIGLDNAGADYIGIIESDDFAAPEMFAELYELITEHECDVIKSDWYEYNGETGSTVKSCKIASKFKTGKISGAKDKKELLQIPASVWSLIYRKSFLTENNIRFLETPGASYQDTSFAFKTIAAAKNIYISDKPYVYYRQDNLNSSVKKKDGAFYICGEYEEIDSFLNANPVLRENFISQKYAKQYKGYRWNLKRIDEKYRREFFERFRDEFKSYYEKGELDEEFFSIVKKKKFLCFINTPQTAWKRLKRELFVTRIRNFTRHILSVRINSSRISISVFGKQIIKSAQ